MPEDVLERTFAESAKFFKRPRGEKDALAWTTPEVCFFCYFGKNLIILSLLLLLLLLPKLRDLANDFFFWFLSRQIEATVNPAAKKSPTQKPPKKSNKSAPKKAPT